MIKKILFLSFFAICFYSVKADTPPESMKHTAMEITSKMGVGWNLGNSLEVPVGEIAWGNPVTKKALIDSVARAGFKTVRIPISWYCTRYPVNCHVVSGTQYTITDEFKAHVKEIVDWCLSDGMYVIVNEHYDDNWLQTKGFTNLSDSNIAAVAAKQKALWEQIAALFKDYDEHLLFASANEPNMNSGVSNSEAMSPALNTYHKAFIDAVRSSGGNNTYRTLIVQSFSDDFADDLWEVFNYDPTPNRICYETHFYGPNVFALFSEDQSWAGGACLYYWGSQNHCSTSARNCSSRVKSGWPYGQEERYVDSVFVGLHRRFVAKGIPVIMGEYGAILRSLSGLADESQDLHNASVKYWNYYVTKTAMANGVAPVYWDDGGSGSNMHIFNRNRCIVYNNYTLSGIMQAYHESDQYVTGIKNSMVDVQRCTDDRIYSIEGRFIGTSAKLQSLPKGIYIMNGRKFVK